MRLEPALKGCFLKRVFVGFTAEFMSTSRKSLVGVLSFFLLAGGLLKSHAATYYWTNRLGGLFSVPANWFLNSLPGVSDTTVFSNAATYVLTVDTGRTNSSALFNQGKVTVAIPGSSWWITNEWRVGEIVSNAASVTLSSGLLAVTNAFGAAVTSIGRNWTGELAVVGGSFVTDVLSATNSGNSVLTLAYGNFTTLHGVTVSNGTLVVGTDATRSFVWNIVGGTNLLLNGGTYDYGGLTLGKDSGVGHAVINLSGSNTTLSVPGLDVYGGNSLSVKGGSSLHTTSVQWGLQINGNNNTILISDPGSSWTNDYLMYFGMHAGGQKMVITNGGYFKTGGTQYDDQHFTAFGNRDNSIIVTGSNSWFNSDGVADFGLLWCSPQCALNNLVLVTNGGHFWARQLTYGSTNLYYEVPTSPGNLVDVADGNLWIGSLTFSVGTLRIEHGIGTIDHMDMNGGTNPVLQVGGNLFMGQHGSLNPGDLAVGGSNAVLAALNGQLQLGGWVIAASAGDTGTVKMIGGIANIANVTQVAPSPGSSGKLTLTSSGTALYTPMLLVGSSGAVAVTNTALLNMSSCAVWGTLDVRTGWASAGAPVSGATPGTLFIGSGGIVSGAGRINGGVFVGSGGKMIANPGAALFTINGNYQQADGGTLSVQLGGSTMGTQFGGLNVSGNVTLAGNLQLDFVNGFAPHAGDTFQILEYGTNAVGGFGQIQISGLAPGAQFSLQTNSARAFVLTALTNTVSTSMPEMFITRSGSNLVVSWSAALTSFSLQSTPSLSQPGWVNWNTVSNSIEFRATNNSRFFRLFKAN
jgi:T5SS/PEP-CTERM-associated repeat protein